MRRALARTTTLHCSFAPAKRNVGSLKCDARRRHASCPLAREDFGTSRFKGSYANLADFTSLRNGVHGPANVSNGSMYGRRPRCKRNLTLSETFGCGHVFGLCVRPSGHWP
jgi:hypothetical protein